MANSLRATIEEKLNPQSDIASAVFAEDFRNRLTLYHALNEDALKKKTFEFAFCGALRAAGRNAVVIANATHPGRDIEVDGIAYSCKTEASQGINKELLTISKLMEARWIRDCATSAHYLAQVKDRVLAHLGEYQRIFVLRAFKLPDGRYEYHLVEIPKSVLMQIGDLREQDFSPRTVNGSSSARVFDQGAQSFILRLDGSVEKVTLSALRTRLCISHAVWKVPVGDPSSLG